MIVNTWNMMVEIILSCKQISTLFTNVLIEPREMNVLNMFLQIPPVRGKFSTHCTGITTFRACYVTSKIQT